MQGKELGMSTEIGKVFVCYVPWTGQALIIGMVPISLRHALFSSLLLPSRTSNSRIELGRLSLGSDLMDLQLMIFNFSRECRGFHKDGRIYNSMAEPARYYEHTQFRLLH